MISFFPICPDPKAPDSESHGPQVVFALNRHQRLKMKTSAETKLDYICQRSSISSATLAVVDLEVTLPTELSIMAA